MRKPKLLKIAGALIIIFVISPMVTYGVWQVQARRAIEAFSYDSIVLANDSLGEDESIPDLNDSVPPKQKVVVPSKSGSIRIDSAGVNMPIYDGESASLLYFGAWRSPWNEAVPGEPGNAVVFGHRYLNLPPSKNTMFNLHKVDVGETIDVDWAGETFTYRVTETKVVLPEDLSVLTETDTPTLTLITCTPIFTTINRLVVTAELVE